MTQRQRLVRAVLCACTAFVPHAGAALDLTGAYRSALSYDPAQLAADEAVVAGREKAVQGRALLKPQVTMSANVSQVHDRTSTGLPAAFSELIKSESSGTVRQVAIQVVQPLYSAKATADKRQLEEQTELAEIRYVDARQDLMKRVGETYFNVLLAEEALQVARAERAAIALQRDRAQARFEVGRGRITELEEAKARYDAVVVRELSSESTLSLRQAQFREVTGRAADGLAALRVPFVPAPLPDNLQVWVSRGEEQHPRVLAKRSEVVIAVAEIDKYKLSGRPSVDLVASYTDRGQSGGLSPTIAPDHGRTAVIGVQLTVPLYTGGALDSRLRETMAKRREAERALDATRRDVRLQIQDAYLAVMTGVARVAALEQSVLSGETALEATTLGRDVGTRTDLDVLDAQQRVFASRLDLAQARTDYMVGRLRLAAASGTLGEGDLRSLDAYLAR